ncbi:hypothetical protein CDD83_1340 [Cordyceps sp. RAO-2017]|nr:hypothetical protein CDD83_1340 [Cordyceps sp. RAO-2017]
MLRPAATSNRHSHPVLSVMVRVVGAATWTPPFVSTIKDVVDGPCRVLTCAGICPRPGIDMAGARACGRRCRYMDGGGFESSLEPSLNCRDGFVAGLRVLQFPTSHNKGHLLQRAEREDTAGEWKRRLGNTGAASSIPTYSKRKDNTLLRHGLPGSIIGPVLLRRPPRARDTEIRAGRLRVARDMCVKLSIIHLLIHQPERRVRPTRLSSRLGRSSTAPDNSFPSWISMLRSLH